MGLCPTCNEPFAGVSARFCHHCGAALELRDSATGEGVEATAEGRSRQLRFGVIDDEGLAQAVREALRAEISVAVQIEREPDFRVVESFAITPDHLATLTGHLDARGSYPGWVRNLTGIEHASNLTSIELLGSTVDDLGPLTHLTGLTDLRLGGRVHVQDLSPLSGLTSLSTLSLGMLEWDVDLSPVADLASLTSLGMSGRYKKDHPNRGVGWRAGDLRHLSDLKHLRDLWLVLRGDEDLAPAFSIPNLKRLSLDSLLSAPGLDGLAGLDSLEKLTINSTSVWGSNVGNRSCAKALESMAGHRGLRELVLTLGGDEDLSVLSSFPALRTLTLRGAGGTASFTEELFRPLSTLTQLTNLTIDANLRLSSQTFGPLDGLSQLESLEISHSGGYELGVSCSLEPLQSLSALKALSLRHLHGVQGLGALSSLRNLENLTLEGLRDLRDSPYMNNDRPLGRYLIASDNWDAWDNRGISVGGRRWATPALGGLVGLPALRSIALLDLPGVRSVRPLRRLPSLTTLSIRGVPAEDLIAVTRNAGWKPIEEPAFGSKSLETWKRPATP